MQDASRDRWLGVLEILAIRKPDEAEAEWAWVMKELELGPEYFLAIYEVVKQGRWREAENPGGYVKASARREARELNESGERKGPRGFRGMQRLDWRDAGEEITIGRAVGWHGRGTDNGGRGGLSADDAGETVSREELLDNLEYAADSGRPVRDSDGTWRTGAGWGTDHEGLLRPAPRPRGRRDFSAEGPLAKYEERLKQVEREPVHMEPEFEAGPDFQEWADKAGLNQWERKVAEYKMRGVGWRDAVAQQPDEESKRALRSAWVTMDRNGIERLRRSIQPVDSEECKKNSSEPGAPEPGNG